MGEVERSVRTIKECTRCHVQRLPYTHYSKLMITSMITHIVISLNQLPSETGIDTHLSPAALITGCSAPDYDSIKSVSISVIMYKHMSRIIRVTTRVQGLSERQHYIPKTQIVGFLCHLRRGSEFTGTGGECYQ